MRPDKEVFYKIAYSDIEKINYKNVLDLCCGTLNSIKHINKSERYVGVDTVKEVINAGANAFVAGSAVFNDKKSVAETWEQGLRSDSESESKVGKKKLREKDSKDSSSINNIVIPNCPASSSSDKNHQFQKDNLLLKDKNNNNNLTNKG